MRILVTAGPTREYLDPVRFLSNASSGRMGCAIAEAAAARGHDVVLVCGPIEVAAPTGVEVRRVTSGAEMLAACLEAFPGCQAAVMAAAVCDFRPVVRQPFKQRRGVKTFTIDLAPTEDICARLGAMKSRRVLLGFALEDREGRVRAEAKLAAKGCDAIVLNGPANMGADSGEVEVFVRDEGWRPSRKGRKEELAAYLVSLIEELVDLRGNTV